ncbi:hypothetical protein YC2023_051639 [Brassica napus]|uniref:Uncharacterized protein n=1 Tax=Brassica oleracea var. oleracea TaxID=109376 RepID=A0A0D3BVV2_BRAOL
MELGGGSSNNLKNKATEGTVLCYCGFPAKIAQAWTDKNPGRRFYGCERYKKALIEARNEIREKNKIITELMKAISKLRSDLVKKEEAKEDIINAFLKL